MPRFFSKLLISLLVFNLLGIPMPSPVQANCKDRTLTFENEEGETVVVDGCSGGAGPIIFGVIITAGVIALTDWLVDLFKDKPVFRDKNDAYLFHEGNNCTQQLVGSLGTTDQPPGRPVSVNAKKVSWFENDEARSVLIQHAAAGEVLRVFDDPEGDVRDDWTDLTILRDIDPDHPYCVGSFEGPKPGKGFTPGFWIDDFIMLVHHHKNGLDGKVSRVENGRDPNFVTRTFQQPMHQGYRLDACLLWGQHCGRFAAQAWCQLRGDERAHRWEVEPFIGEHSPTIVLGSGQICDQWYCGGFSTITCSTFGIPLPPSPWE